MPEWFDAVANTSLATGLIGFICWGVVKLSKFLGPKFTAIVEGHVATMASLSENSTKQTELIGRQVQMVDAIHTKQGEHGDKLGRLEIRVDEIHEIVRGKQ